MSRRTPTRVVAIPRGDNGHGPGGLVTGHDTGAMSRHLPVTWSLLRCHCGEIPWWGNAVALDPNHDSGHRPYGIGGFPARGTG